MTRLLITFWQVCEDRGLAVSRGLAGAALRHAYQTPRHGFDGGEALDGDEVARLIEVAADALANDRGPAMETLRMQVSRRVKYDRVSKKIHTNLAD